MGLLAAQIALGIYAALLAVGGLIGFLKAGSRPSLIAGVGSGIVAIGALLLTFQSPVAGLVLGLVLALGLIFMFAKRYRKSGKFMPSGLLLVTSVVMVLVLYVPLVGRIL
jgi:uncharacterized membrane protein (UPF0136 family)